MTYKLLFDNRALKEWKKLAPPVSEQFKKKLKERLENPCVISDKLSGYANRYKIKLRTLGYRLVYEVNNNEITVLVLAIGKRSKDSVYIKASKR